MKLRQFILLLIAITVYGIGLWFLLGWPRDIVTRFEQFAFLCALILFASCIISACIIVMGFIILLYDGKILPPNHWLNKKLW